jgi:2-alkyl-3-oxoalkanoate reductase
MWTMTTRVLVAGASGTLGRPLVGVLLAGGYQVAGLTRAPSRRHLIESLGAEAVVADALDADALRAAVQRAAPDVVVHLLTALPAGGPTKASDLAATNRLRRTGTTNLLAAAVAAGTRRLVAESMVLVHGFGDFGATPLTEAEPLRPPGRTEVALVGAVRDLERQVLEADTASRIEGIVLRYGMLYGAATGSTQAMVRRLRRWQLPLPGGGYGSISWIHVDDATTATVAALERGRPGEVYNVVDDEPVRWRDYTTQLARLADAPPPPSLPLWLSRLVAPFGTRLLTSRLPLSNAKARRELGWAPAFPTYREGLAELATARTADAAPGVVLPVLGGGAETSAPAGRPDC